MFKRPESIYKLIIVIIDVETSRIYRPYLFLDGERLFDHIKEINVKFKEYKEESFVGELFSNSKEIHIPVKT